MARRICRIIIAGIGPTIAIGIDAAESILAR
jgi:hypothetical protein